MSQHRLFNRLLPNPGSHAAMKLGCTCNMLDNQFGYGNDTSGYTQQWAIADDCVMHNELSHEFDMAVARKSAASGS